MVCNGWFRGSPILRNHHIDDTFPQSISYTSGPTWSWRFVGGVKTNLPVVVSHPPCYELAGQQTLSWWVYQVDIRIVSLGKQPLSTTWRNSQLWHHLWCRRFHFSWSDCLIDHHPPHDHFQGNATGNSRGRFLGDPMSLDLGVFRRFSGGSWVWKDMGPPYTQWVSGHKMSEIENKIFKICVHVNLLLLRIFHLFTFATTMTMTTAITTIIAIFSSCACEYSRPKPWVWWRKIPRLAWFGECLMLIQYQQQCRMKW